MPRSRVARPSADEFAPYYSRYIDLVPGDDAVPALRTQIVETLKLLAGVSEAKAAHRYAPGKWSIKQVVGHLSDGERVFAYRALRFGRGDPTPLPGFDENTYAQHAGSDTRQLADLVEEYRCVRAASVSLFESLDAAALVRRGSANNQPISVRSLAWIAAGHELHHRAILRERYGVGG